MSTGEEGFFARVNAHSPGHPHRLVLSAPLHLASLRSTARNLSLQGGSAGGRALPASRMQYPLALDVIANGVATASCKGLTAPRRDRLGRSLWSATPASPAGRRDDNQVVMQRANAAEVRELKPPIRYRSRERLESLGRRLQPRALMPISKPRIRLSAVRLLLPRM
jgi:hypothetical protein